MRVLEADYTFVDGRLVPNLAVVLGDDGLIADLGGPERFPDRTRLSGQALLPGLVNAHSHAFQRALRGRTESRDPRHPHDDFWTWREQMYRLAERLTPDLLHDVSQMAYLEMLLSGITAVGEFHYLQNTPDGLQYENPDELALQVVRAAGDAGIRQVLLRVAYARPGFHKPLMPAQRRFIEPDVDDVLAAVQRLRSHGVACGVAPHSVRAVPRDWLSPLHRFTRDLKLPFHMHVAEQPAEIEACVAEYGLRPVQLLADEGCLDRLTTAVHGIHLNAEEIALLGGAGSTICVCPTTERNLGDGIAPADHLQEAGVPLALGTDSHTQINLWEDARELDLHRRLESRTRVVLSQGRDLPRRLTHAATEAGARSLGLLSGVIAPGRPADLVSVSVDDPSVCASDEEELLANLVFSLERTAIRNVWVEGRRIVVDGRHPRQESIIERYREAIAVLWEE